MFNLSKKVKIVGTIIIIAVVVFNAPSQKEIDAEKKIEIEKLKSDVLKLPALEVEKNFDIYSRLIKLDSENVEYKKKYLLYKKFYDFESKCRSSSRAQDKSSLKNPSTYGSESNRNNKWLSKTEFITSSNFTGKNLLGIEQTFKSEYKCTIAKDGLHIKKVFLKPL